MSDNQSTENPAAIPPPMHRNIKTTADRVSPHTIQAKQKKHGCLIAALIVAFTVPAILVFILILGLLSSIFSSPRKPDFPEKYISGNEFSENKIAVIDITGVIMTNGPSGKIASARTICEQFRFLVRDDSKVKAVIIRINSPGGGVVASDMIHQAILRLRREHQLPVIAVMETVAASGGYYVAVACEEIIANRLTITGSIGVIAQSYNFHKLLEKIGVDGMAFKSGKMKDMLNPARPRNQAENKIMQQMIDKTYEEFVNIVAAGRQNLTAKQIKNSIIGDSRILDGAQAYKLKMVDRLGYFEDAVKIAAKKAKLGQDYVVVRYQPPFSLEGLFRINSPVDKLKIEFPGNGKISSELKPGQLYFLPAGL